jgi:hypothetical protein
MFYLNSTFTDTDSILSRRDALLRTLGVALRASFVASIGVVGLLMAGVSTPMVLLPLAALVASGAAALAWRRLSARILPDGITMLTGRALLRIAVALAGCAVAGLVAYELTLHGSLMTLSPRMPLLAAQLGGLSVYAWCMRIARQPRIRTPDRDTADFVASVVGDVLGAVIDAGASSND